MKSSVRMVLGIALLHSFLTAPTRAQQQGADGKKSLPVPVQVTPEAKKPDPVGKPAVKPTDKKKPADKEGKIDGIAVARPNGTWLGLNAKGGVFCLSFFDSRKKPLEGDAMRATARWQSPKFKNQQNDILNLSSDKKALYGSKAVVPPRNFKVYLTLLDQSGQAMENYVVDYRE